MARLSAYALLFYIMFGWNGRLEAAATMVDPADVSGRATASATAGTYRPPLDPLFPNPELLLQLLPILNGMDGDLHQLYNTLAPACEDPLNFWCGMASDLATKMIDTALFGQIGVALNRGPYKLEAAPLDELNSYPACFFADWHVVGLQTWNLYSKEEEGGESISEKGLGCIFLALEHPITRLRLGCIGARNEQSMRKRLINSIAIIEGGNYTKTQTEIARRLGIIFSNYTEQLPDVLTLLGFDSDIHQNLKGTISEAEFEVTVRNHIIETVLAWDKFRQMHGINIVAGHGLPGMIASTHAIAYNRINASSRLRSRVYGALVSEGFMVPIFMGILNGEELSAFEKDVEVLGVVKLSDIERAQHQAFCSTPIFDSARAPVGSYVALPSWKAVNAILKPYALRRLCQKNIETSGEDTMPCTSSDRGHVVDAAPAVNSGAAEAQKLLPGWVEVDLTDKTPVAATAIPEKIIVDGVAISDVPTPVVNVDASTSVVARILNPLNQAVSPVTGFLSSYVPSVGTMLGYVPGPVKAATSYIATPVAAVVTSAVAYMPNTTSLADTVKVGDVVIKRFVDGGYEITLNGGATVVRVVGNVIARVSSGAIDAVKDMASTVMSHLPKIPFMIDRTVKGTDPSAIKDSAEAQADDVFGLDGSIHPWMRIFAYNNATMAASILYDRATATLVRDA